jgi:hypothetical protein
LNDNIEDPETELKEEGEVN